MKSYWLWLLFHAIVWVYALLYLNKNLENLTWNLLGTAFYFIIFFITPLFKNKQKILLTMFIINAFLVVFILYPFGSTNFNPFLLLILSLLFAQGFYYLKLIDSIILGSFISIVILLIPLTLNGSFYIKVFIYIYWILLFAAMILYKKTKELHDDLDARYDALLSEYRNLKRQRLSEDEISRQEERMLIAHEIHDSVGHKLTALLMQLEAFRLHVTDKEKDHVQQLKELAEESLEETRRAVRSLKTKETGGLPGILRLIRKLEMESFMRIHFSVKHGAFTAPLSGEQAFVIYRSVQEALTNIMKHSTAREANITFEAPGGSIFRFEISNPTQKNNEFQEGFGLTSMRERLQRFNGDLEVFQMKEQFIVRGYLKLDLGD